MAMKGAPPPDTLSTFVDRVTRKPVTISKPIGVPWSPLLWMLYLLRSLNNNSLAQCGDGYELAGQWLGRRRYG